MKEFNYTGTCIPGMHYMVDTTPKIDLVLSLINKRKYFTINRPRQFGKTTTMFLLYKKLQTIPEYLVLKTSFEGLGNDSFNDEGKFSQAFFNLLMGALKKTEPELTDRFSNQKEGITNFDPLSEIITALLRSTEKKVVILIDEVDQASNNELFIKFLALLRRKYLLQNEGDDTTFHSVILAGVHDVKTLKLKLRPGETEKYNSPWNIAVDFTVDLSFSAKEIETMLVDYSQAEQVEMDIPVVAEKLRFFTSGYPFLVSKICHIINDRIMDKTTIPLKWAPRDVEEGVKEILKEDNTNFQSLIKNLENNRELYDFIRRIVLDGENIPLVKTDSIISLGITYGLLKNDTTYCRMHNHVYQQLIYDHMMIGVLREHNVNKASYYNTAPGLIDETAEIFDIEKVLLKFQQFMKEQYSEKDLPFIERNGRLIFLAFLKPIINGKGFDFKEVQISEEKRLDVVITYFNKKYIIELKIWRGEEANQAGLNQLADYLERQNCDTGYLLIFDFNTGKIFKHENISIEDSSGTSKQIFAVWV